MKAPCKNCEARAPGCHSVCGKYKELCGRFAQIREEKRKRYEADSFRAATVIKYKQRYGGDR